MRRTQVREETKTEKRDERTFVSDGEVVGSMAPAIRRVGDDANLYAVAKRRVNKRLAMLATGAYRVAQS